MSYHDSIEATRYKFDDTKVLLHQFLTDIGCHNITINYASTAQQEDGCSCGIFVLAGIIMHIYNRQSTLHRHEVSCFRRELFYSVLRNRLSTEHSLKTLGTHKRTLLHLYADNRTKQRRTNDSSTSIPGNKVNPTGKRTRDQALITDLFKLKSPIPSDGSVDPYIKRAKPEQGRETIISKHKKRKITKKLQLKEGIYPKTYD